MKILLKSVTFRHIVRSSFWFSRVTIFTVTAFIICVVMIQASSKASSAVPKLPDILDFFPEVNHDISQITWGHAINSRELINKALNQESTIMMLEADVSEGYLTGESNTSKPIPIMSHPPKTESDISLEMWITKVIKANQEGFKRGAKLDFKNPRIIMKSLELLRKHSSEIDFPLWLNADILKGPGGENSKPIDADIFLSLCSEFFPSATLSIGWTTKYNNDRTQKYTEQMIQDMQDIIQRNNIHQPITFPIRASFVSASLNSIEKLMKSLPEATVTIWTSDSDTVNLEGLASLQNLLGDEKVYFDISEDQKAEVSTIRKRIRTSNSSSGGNLITLGSISLVYLLYYFTVLCETLFYVH